MPSDGNGQVPEGAIRGRYMLAPADAGGAMLYWTTELCDQCKSCGCGNQRAPLDLTPAGSMKTFLRLRQLQKNGIDSE